MAITQDLLNELRLEGAVTRKYLALVPFDKADYRPAHKSETLGRLAIHVAEIIAWWKSALTDRELDFIDFVPRDIKTTDELLSYFDELLLEAESTLSRASDADLNKNWSMRHGDVVYFTLPAAQVLRLFCMNHLVHHRAQLGVYLRMLDISVPASYGPSADDEDVILSAGF
jgi:uncharacterized damage-inducible protein DinB